MIGVGKMRNFLYWTKKRFKRFKGGAKNGKREEDAHVKSYR